MVDDKNVVATVPATAATPGDDLLASLTASKNDGQGESIPSQPPSDQPAGDDLLANLMASENDGQGNQSITPSQAPTYPPGYDVLANLVASENAGKAASTPSSTPSESPLSSLAPSMAPSATVTTMKPSSLLRATTPSPTIGTTTLPPLEAEQQPMLQPKPDASSAAAAAATGSMGWSSSLSGYQIHLFGWGGPVVLATTVLLMLPMQY